MKISDLQEKKLSELREIAKAMHLSGYSQMRKQDLIYLILEARAEAAAGKNGGPRRGRERAEATVEEPRPERPSEPARREASPRPAESGAGRERPPRPEARSDRAPAEETVAAPPERAEPRPV
ncbi:Rho termination factor N-terminal domain-containing protein, partial [Rhodocaloribacter litoris]|uniref:Rho termination factor N-terminal domain-containing protein n=1 Tax=Rhodocaloribacter litoris TaxID=2558931 RepID=UPI001E40D8ED